MIVLLVPSAERPRDIELGSALARAVERLSGDEGGAVEDCTRERWCAGDVPSFPKLAAQIGVPLDTLCEVFAEEIYLATGQILRARRLLQ